jgi:hypothetical protein
MRTPTRILTAALAAVLSLGLVATTADAASHTATKKDDGVKATLVVHDIKNKVGKITDKQWLTLTVRTPAAAHDIVDGYDYGVTAVHWYARLTITGAPSCRTTITSDTHPDGSGRWVVPVSFTTKRWTRTTSGSYVTAGLCKVSAEVTAYRYAQNPALDVDAHFFVKTAAAIQNDVRTTKPHASATTVKKYGTVTFTGTVTYQKATATVPYLWRAAPKGSKVVVQFRAKGASAWKNVKATTVTGTHGHWSAKVKVARSGSYRIYSLPTSTRQAQASAYVAITAR